MSQHHPWFDDEDGGNQPPPPRQLAERPRRPRTLFVVAAIAIALFVGSTLFAQFWTEKLWYDSVGYASVFSTVIWTRIGLFLVFGAVMALAVGGSMVLAYRLRPLFRLPQQDQAGLDRYRDVVLPVRWILLVGTSLVLGAFAGASASSQWRSFMLWRHGEDFGTEDPFFRKDVGFYVFDLPWFHYVVDFVLAIAVISLMMSAVVHYLFGGINLQARGERLTPGATAHLSALLGVFVLAKSADYALDRYDTLTSSGRLVDGATYADIHASIPARNILIWIAMICAVLFFVNIWRRSWRLPSVGLILMVVSALVMGMIWPGLVQRFEVNPSPQTKERPYIQANIDATRAAYDIEDVEEVSYPGSVAVESAKLRDEALKVGIRLVDPRLVSQTFDQKQQIKAYYSVPEVLDVDRYEIDGQERDLVVSVRELNQDGVPESGQNWQTLHGVYTHGYGMIAAFGNQRGVDNREQVTAVSDGVAWAEENLPPSGQLTDLAGEKGYRGQIYFSENAPSYSVVGKKKGAPDLELDLPEGSIGDRETTTTYDGLAGVPVGSLSRRLLYAVKYGEPNFLLSDVVNENSKILYHRDPSEMVRQVAPWLVVDGDPFPAMIDGKVVWLLDGYTTSNQYPQAEKDSFEAMTTDALTRNTAFRTVPTDEINYMRNAVKIVVDAYDGTVELYEWDQKDPLLKAWTKAFPNTVRPKSEIPESVLEHMRYPEDMFKVQRYQLAAYHVDNADDFFQRNDQWEVPTDPNSPNSDRLQPPYRLSVAMPDEEGNQRDPVFSLTSVYKPFGAERQNLDAFVSVNADAAHEEYGKFQVLTLRGGRQVPGPGQISNNIQGAERVKQALLSFTNDAGSKVDYGNLLTLPVGRGLMYVQPIYTQRSSGVGNYPQLQFVVVSFGEKVGIGKTLEDAISDILGVSGQQGTEQPPTDGGSPSTPTGTLSAAVRAELEAAMEDFKLADQRQKANDTAGWASALADAQAHVEKAAQIAEREQKQSEKKSQQP